MSFKRFQNAPAIPEFIQLLEQDIRERVERTGDRMLGDLDMNENDLNHVGKIHVGEVDAETVTTSGNATVEGSLSVVGDLTVQGTTTTVNSTTVQIDDPVLTLGPNAATNDQKDRGIEFRYGDGATAKTGFFGWDRSNNRFVLYKDATNASEVFTGTVGDLQVGRVFDLTGAELADANGEIDWQRIKNKTAASTSGPGIVQLIDSNTSSSLTKAPTAKALSATRDLAAAKEDPLTFSNGLSRVNDAVAGIDATTSARGVVVLSNAVDSASETDAATPFAVKTTYDLADTKLTRAGDTMSGALNMDENDIENIGTATTTTLAVVQNATLGGTLGVDGKTTLSGDLKVEQETEMVGNVTIEGTLDVTGTSTMKGNATVEGTLDVVGNTNVSTLAASSDVTVTGLVSGSTATFTGDVTAPTFLGNLQGTTGALDELTVPTLNSTSLDARFDTHGKYTKAFYVSADDGDDANHGQSNGRPLKTIRHAVSLANAFVQSQTPPIKATGVVIHVGPGKYEEELPILVEENVAIVGDSLRNVLLFPAPGFEQADYFHAKSGTYFTGLRFRHLRHPAACVAFPCAICDVRVTQQAVVPPPGLSDPPVLFSYPGYDSIPPVYVDSPNISDTIVLRIEVADPGLGYVSGDINASSLVVTNRDGTDPIEFAGIDAVSFDGSGRITSVTLASFFDVSRNKTVFAGGKGYDGGAVVDVPPPADPNGRKAQFRCIMTDDIAEIKIAGLDVDGRIDGMEIVHPGFGYTERPFVSIPAPTSIQPFVIASPYVQNCSNISGPFDLDGEPVSALTPLPYDVNNVLNAQSNPRQVDPEGSGMGLRVDGACVRSDSPLRSFVTDAFTQVSQGGIGFLLINRAYAQLVSTFGTFCSAHIKAIGGSTVNVSNTVTDFGTEGLHARGYWPVPYATADVIAPYDNDGIQAQDVFGLPAGMYIPQSGYRSSIRFLSDATERGEGYTIDENDPIVITIDPPTRPETGAITARFDPGPDGESDPVDFATDPDAEPVSTILGASSLENGRLRDTLTLARDGPGEFTGAGYEILPTVTVTGGSPSKQAEIVVRLSGVNPITIEIQGDDKQPEFLSVCRVHGNWHTIQGVTRVLDANGQPIANRYAVSLFPTLDFLNETDIIEFFNASYISTNSHVMEFVGSGVTFNALPEFGGIPNPANEIVERAPGRIFYTTSDHLGNTKIGKLFEVEQLTGEVTIATERFNLSGLSAIGPFSRGGVPVGVQLREVSADTQLRSSTGAVDGNTVPTQSAVKAYVDRLAVTEVTSGTNGQYLRVFEGDFPPYRWDTLDASSIDQGTLDNARLPSHIDVETVTADLTGNLTGNTTVGGTLGVTGNTTLSDELAVTGATTLTGNASLGGTLGVTGNTTLSADLAVTGATTLTGNASLGGTLGVTGNTTLSADLAVTGTSTLTGNASLGGTLAVTGNTTLSADLAVSGATTLTGNASLGGTLDVTGKTTVNDELAVTGATTLTGNASLGGTLDVTGESAFDSKVTVPELYVGTTEVINASGNVASAARIPNLSANKITSDVFAVARIPNLSATKITSDALDTARIPGLSATKITSDTLPVGRGGTGQPSLAAHAVLVGNGTSGVKTPTQLHWDDANKRLGIGTSTPTTALDVDGTVTATTYAGSLDKTVTFVDGTGATVATFDNTDDVSVPVGSGINASVDAQGAPEYTGFEKTEGAFYGGDANEPDGTTRLNYDGVLHAAGFVGALDANLLTGTIDEARLPQGGSVDPTEFVSVTGDIMTGDLLFDRSDPETSEIRRIGTVTEDEFGLRTYNTDRIRILSSGQVGIGENYSPNESYQLDVDGSIYASGDVVLFSDARYKIAIETVDDALETVCRMRGVRYRWRDDPDARTHVGLIAQEVERAFPEAIRTDAATGKMSVAYPALIGPLVEAIKDLRDRNADLTQCTSLLTETVSALTDRNATLTETVSALTDRLAVIANRVTALESALT